jgi:hypothetical protein
MNEIGAKITKECHREAESCLYTSVTFFEWLKSLRFWRRVCIATPIALGGVGTWSVLDQPDNEILIWTTAAMTLTAGILPAIYEALKVEVHIAGVAETAGEFKNLQDRFRQLAEIHSLDSPTEIADRFENLMHRLEAARSRSYTPPERFFGRAQKKIQAGHYSFASDCKSSD